MPRPPRPEDLYRLRTATDPRLSPDGSQVAVTLQTVAPGIRWLSLSHLAGPVPRAESPGS